MALLLFSFLLSGYIPSEVFSPPSPSPTPLPFLVERAEIRGWREGRISWVLKAKDLKFDRMGNQAQCQGEVELVVYTDEGEPRSILKADSATIDLERKIFRFRGSVEVISREGDRIVTEELLYRDQLKMLETKSLTQVFFNGNTIECERLTSDIDFNNPEFYKIRRGSFHIGK
ncbi:MAG: LPS export ABC transporter periplasmic protein LptC [Candidatus Caldatribacteriaceae bacterium]